MPKIDYEKQPFRLCRWNTKINIPKDPNQLHRPTKEFGYYCEDGEQYVNEQICMPCFCNTWYKHCNECGKEILKTKIIRIFHLDGERIVFVCKKCYNGEETLDYNISNVKHEIETYLKKNK